MAGRKRGRIIGYIALQLRYIRTEKHPNFFVFSPFLLFFYTLSWSTDRGLHAVNSLLKQKLYEKKTGVFSLFFFSREFEVQTMIFSWLRGAIIITRGIRRKS